MITPSVDDSNSLAQAQAMADVFHATFWHLQVHTQLARAQWPILERFEHSPRDRAKWPCHYEYLIPLADDV